MARENVSQILCFLKDEEERRLMELDYGISDIVADSMRDIVLGVERERATLTIRSDEHEI